MNLEVARAAAAGDVETVNKWLTARGYTHYGQSAAVIYHAFTNGHDKICQLLLDCTAISIDEQLMDMALRTACEFNQLSIAKRVIQHCSTVTNTLIEALSQASVRGNAHIVKWLTSDVMHLSYTDRIRWMFVTACVCCHVSNIQQLATRVHSDVTRVMSQALRLACYNGRHDVVKWLTSHTTADVSSVDALKTIDGPMTSLMAACNMGHNRIGIQLLQCVTPHTINMMSGEYRDTALHLTCFSETDGRLFSACADGNIDDMSDLLYTSDVNLQGRDGATSIHIACRYGHVEATRLLLSVFARTDITDINRETPAMLAQEFKYTMLERYLRQTLTDTSDNNCTSTHVTETSTNTVTISLSSIAYAQQNNTKSRKSNQVIKSTSTIKRIV